MNEQHSKAPSQQREKSKKCSGCQARAYCSTRCQKADWDAHHQHECGGMRQSTAVEADCAGELRLSDRAHLAAFVERLCNKHMGEFRSYARRAFLVPLGSLILTVDGISVPATGTLSTVVEFLASVKKSLGGNVPYRRRINDYLRQMPEIRVACAVFPLGLLTVHLLVRMQDDGNDILRVVSFMTIGIRYAFVRPAELRFDSLLANAKLLILSTSGRLVGYAFSWVHKLGYINLGTIYSVGCRMSMHDV